MKDIVNIELNSVSESSQFIRDGYLKYASEIFNINKDDLDINDIVVGVVNLDTRHFGINDFTINFDTFSFVADEQKYSVNIGDLKAYRLNRNKDQLVFLGIKNKLQ